MTTQAPSSSPHLAAVGELLDDLGAVTQRADCDSQTKAVTATAHAVLVLAEQVAAIRLLMVGDAVASRANGQPAQQGEQTPKKRGWW